MTDTEYEEAVKNDLYFIAQNLPDKLSVKGAHHVGGYDFDIVLGHEDGYQYALSSHYVRDRIKNDTLVSWIEKRHASFEDRAQSFNELKEGDQFKIARTNHTIWVKDKVIGIQGNAYNFNDDTVRIYVNPIERVQEI